jgi:hypothetical protein
VRHEGDGGVGDREDGRADALADHALADRLDRGDGDDEAVAPVAGALDLVAQASHDLLAQMGAEEARRDLEVAREREEVEHRGGRGATAAAAARGRGGRDRRRARRGGGGSAAGASGRGRRGAVRRISQRRNGEWRECGAARPFLLDLAR